MSSFEALENCGLVDDIHKQVKGVLVLEEKRALSPETEADIYRRIIRAILSNVGDRQIAIWGTREKGKLAMETVESLGARCGFFVSTHPKTAQCHGLPLYKPDILDPSKHFVIRATSSSAVDRFLQESGFRGLGRDYASVREYWHDDIEYEKRLVGRGTYGYQSLSADFGSVVKSVGRYCSINDSARVVGNHPLNYVTTHVMLYNPDGMPPREKWRSTAERLNGITRNNGDIGNNCKRGGNLVEIGNDVWIGANVVIMPGIKIGDGAVLGAGAVVTKDVEPYAIVGGVPAKVIKYRYSREMIDALLRIEWWNWPVEKLEENLELLYSPELFCKIFDDQWNFGN